MLLQLFLVMLLSVEVHLAPVMEVEACNIPVRDDIQDEVDEILKEGLLNNTNNIDKIKTAFEVKSGQVKICVPLNYTIFCAKEECGDCSSGYSYSSIWTNFDTSTLAGGFLFDFASLNWTVFGFEWAGACDLRIENTPVLNISVSSLAVLCGVDNWEEYISASLQHLTQQVSESYYDIFFTHFLNFTDAIISELASSHTADRCRFRGYVEVTTGLACLLSIGVLIPVYLQAKVVTQPGSRKPKAYFQFWAFHVFATSFVIYTVIQNYEYESNNVLSLVMLIWAAVSGFGIGIFSLTKFNIETPTHFCMCCHGFSHCIVLWMSLCSSLLFITFALFSIPTIILVYYLYPARTLLRLPLLTNAVLYINSLLALLLFQCERLCFPFVENFKPIRMQRTCDEDKDKNCLIKRFCGNLRGALEQRAISHNKFYSSYYSESLTKKDYLMFITYLCSPIGTVIILAILILFVIIIHDLTDLHISSVKDLNLNLLLTLAPTLLLLLVSWYKFDIFYDLKDEEEKSKKEILQAILEKINPAGTGMNELPHIILQNNQQGDETT